MNTIKKGLGKDKTYTKDGVVLKYYEEEKEDPAEQEYLVDLKGEFRYIGVMNLTLKRTATGKNVHRNNDTYYGFWRDDQRDGVGVYISHHENETQLFNGVFKKNIRQDKGVCFWKTNINNETYDNSIFDAFVGNFQDDKMLNGFYYSKAENNKGYAYCGNFDNNLKTDDDCVYYQLHDNTMFIGNIINDEFIDGFLVILDKNTNKQTTFVKYTKDENGVARTEEQTKLDPELILELNDRVKEFFDISNVDLFKSLYASSIDYQKLVDEIKDFKCFEEADYVKTHVDKLYFFNDLYKKIS